MRALFYIFSLGIARDIVPFVNVSFVLGVSLRPNFIFKGPDFIYLRTITSVPHHHSPFKEFSFLLFLLHIHFNANMGCDTEVNIVISCCF